MSININVVDQKMMVTSGINDIASGTKNFVKFKFELEADWDDLTVFAQFRQGSNSYNRYLDSDNCCYLPSDVEPGTCAMILYGTSGSGTSAVIGTTNYLTLTIVDNGFVADASSTEMSASLYTQLIARIDSIQDELTLDSTPTSGSTNLVSSGGVKTALDLKLNKNLGSALAGQYVYVGSTGEISTVSVSPTYQNEDPYAVHYTADSPSTTEQGIARDNIDVYSTSEIDTLLGNKVDKTTFEALGLSVVDGALNITYTEE